MKDTIKQTKIAELLLGWVEYDPEKITREYPNDIVYIAEFAGDTKPYRYVVIPVEEVRKVYHRFRREDESDRNYYSRRRLCLHDLIQYYSGLDSNYPFAGGVCLNPDTFREKVKKIKPI